eukprot:403356625
MKFTLKQLTIIASLLLIQVCSEKQLLYVYDIVSHGSIVPPGPLIDPDYSKVTYTDKPGQVTPFGQRQMYLLGLEMRRRYIESRNFLSSKPNANEFYAFAIDYDPALVSAQAFMSGFYPANLQERLSDNQTVVAVPPIVVDNLDVALKELDGYPILHNIQTVPIHSNAGEKFDMLFSGYSQNTCPIIGKIQAYQAQNDTQIRQDFDKSNQAVNEMLKTNQELFKNIQTIFDGKMKAQLNILEPDNTYLLEQKFFYQQTNIDQIQSLYAGLDLNQVKPLSPEFTSSILIEFYQKEGIDGPFTPTSFNREDYYVKFYVNDEPVKLPQVTCDDEFFCQYESLVIFFSTMNFKDVITGLDVKDMETFCNAQLNYENVVPTPDSPPSGIPWWLAVVIAVPLVIITIAIIKIVMIIKEKRRRKFEEAMAMYNRLTPSNAVNSNTNSLQKQVNHRLSVNTVDDSDHNSTI